MKKINKEQENQIKSEVLDLIHEQGLWIGKCEVQLRQGGRSAWMMKESGILSVRIDTWLKMELFGKRLLIIHEALHHHLKRRDFPHDTDFISIQMYLNLYGPEDSQYLMAKAVTGEKINQILHFCREVKK